jgi:hypothetical protein
MTLFFSGAFILGSNIPGCVADYLEEIADDIDDDDDFGDELDDIVDDIEDWFD